MIEDVLDTDVFTTINTSSPKFMRLFNNAQCKRPSSFLCTTKNFSYGYVQQ